jgi:hypothetical protein
MLLLIARRLGLGLLVALTVMTLAFMLTRLSGDLAISIAGPSATQADVEIIRKAYGLDRPLYVQFFSWVGRAMVGDFGESYFFKDSVSSSAGIAVISFDLPSTSRWPSDSPCSLAQALKQASKASGSISMKTRRKVSCEGMPLAKLRNDRSQPSLLRP